MLFAGDGRKTQKRSENKNVEKPRKKFPILLPSYPYFYDMEVACFSERRKQAGPILS